MCAKLCTVAASNHAPRSLYYCLFAPHIYGCCSSRTSRPWCITHSTQRQRRSCSNIPSFLQQTALIRRSFCEGCMQHDHILVTAPFCRNANGEVAIPPHQIILLVQPWTDSDHGHKQRAGLLLWLWNWNWSFFISASSCNPLLGREWTWGRFWAAIQLSHRPEPSGHAVLRKING